MQVIYSLILAILLFAPSIAHSTFYWVATSGNDGNSCGAIDSTSEGSDPGTYKLTISSALTCVSAGDTVLVKNGTYVLTNDISIGLIGTSGSPITVKAQNLLGAIITDNALGVQKAFQIGGSWIVVDGFEITGFGEDPAVNPNGGGGAFYLSGSNNTLRRNYIHDIGRAFCTNSAYSYSGIYTPGGTNNVVERNVLYRIGRRRPGESGCGSWNPDHDHGIYWESGNNFTVRYNLFYDNAAGYDIHRYGGSGVSGGRIYNNTFGGPTSSSGAAAIIIASGTSDFDISNNIFYDPGAAWPNSVHLNSTSSSRITNNITNKDNLYDTLASGWTQSGNVTSSSTINFVDPATKNYALQSNSAAINAGNPNRKEGGTFPFNGSAPDMGAHETFIFSACSVEQGDASMLRVTFTNNLWPPLGGISTTGWSYRINAGASISPSNAILTGSNRIDLTLQAALTAGQTIDFSYTTAGSIRDSVQIGGTHNQRLNAITTQSCTNNVSGAGPSNLTVSHFRFHSLRSSSTSNPEANRYVLMPIDNNATVRANGIFGLRTKIKCTTGDCVATGFNLRYQKDGSGGYANIPDTCGTDNIAFFGTVAAADIPNDGTATTEQLTGDFATNVAGAIVRTSSAIPNIDLSQDSETELEHLLIICTASVGTFYDFRPYKQDGTALDAYTFTPRITVVNARFWQ